MTFDDGPNEDLISTSSMDLFGSPELQHNEEGLMFDHGQNHDDSGRQNEAVSALMSLFDNSCNQPRYSNLCLERDICKNKGKHFDDFMQAQFKAYNVRRNDQSFFRNNAFFDETRFYSFCDHLAANQSVLQQVFPVFQEQGALELIRDTIRLRLSSKKSVMPNLTKNPLYTSTVVNDTGMQLLLSCISVSVLFPVYARRVMCCASQFPSRPVSYPHLSCVAQLRRGWKSYLRYFHRLATSEAPTLLWAPPASPTQAPSRPSLLTGPMRIQSSKSINICCCASRTWPEIRKF